MITIRRYSNIDNIPGLVKHIQNNWGVGHRTWDAPSRWWWAGQDDEIAVDKRGFICYSGLYVFTQEACVVGPTYIFPDYRGLGLQFKMLKKRIEFAKKMGFSKILSSTYSDNYPSMNNLIKAGFYTTEPWCEAEENGMYWAKDL